MRSTLVLDSMSDYNMDQGVLPSARHRRGRGHHRGVRGQGGIRRVAPRTPAQPRGQQRGRGQVALRGGRRGRRRALVLDSMSGAVDFLAMQE